MKLVKQIPLENGLTVSFFNHNHRYFGDYHKVRVEITCEVAILEEYFATPDEFAEAMASLGASAVFRRSLEQMGVSTDELEDCLDRVIENFINHSLSYIASPGFPRKLIQKELANITQPNRRTYSN
jgi:hypothetical protein